MRNITKITLSLCIGLAMGIGQAVAGPKPDQLHRLSEDLTPMGSERAGNADGTIPEWTGGITTPPEIYKPGDHHQNPFPEDKPLFRITGANYQEHGDKLSVGQKATFAKYPDTYFMDVYPSRRSASFPEHIYEMTAKNGGTATLGENGEGVLNAAEGFPFPFPENAYELMWNHKLKYKGTGGVRYNSQIAPTAGGSYSFTVIREELLGLYYKRGVTIEEIDNILLYFFQEVESPARLAGNILLVHETLNQQITARQAWIYNPGQRRVRRAPNVAYDNPGTASDGLRTNDMTDMFNGAMDRFDWKVIGKEEMYIPYNSYGAHAEGVTNDEFIRPGHLNPELMRYELHRVWVVEANLKDEYRHIYKKRVFYIDEDSWNVVATDKYDNQDKLWRYSEGYTINFYEVPTTWSTIEAHYDLQSGRYVAQGFDNTTAVNTFNVELSPSQFTPQALRSRGRR
jgi:hypothetical protein